MNWRDELCELAVVIGWCVLCAVGVDLISAICELLKGAAQ